MSDLNREQFEEWHRSVVDGEPPHEKYSDGSYINPHVNRYWTGWQASRECLVIELPGRGPSFTVGGVTSFSLKNEGRNEAIKEIEVSIHAVGVKTK